MSCGEPDETHKRPANKQKEVVLHTACIKTAVLKVYVSSRVDLKSTEQMSTKLY